MVILIPQTFPLAPSCTQSQLNNGALVRLVDWDLAWSQSLQHSNLAQMQALLYFLLGLGGLNHLFATHMQLQHSPACSTKCFSTYNAFLSLQGFCNRPFSLWDRVFVHIVFGQIKMQLTISMHTKTLSHNSLYLYPFYTFKSNRSPVTAWFKIPAT